MTIGVLDECRKLGIGSFLLQSTLRALSTHPEWQSQVKFIYLHVADYNDQAIRFYAKNGFEKLKVLKEWYTIFEKPYDAILLFKKLEGGEVITSELKL
jgi:ribosomal protein S18 acetylase RimI-like enzyme